MEEVDSTRTSSARTATTVAGVTIVKPLSGPFQEILTSDALTFVAELQRKFGPTREKLLAARKEREERIFRGEKLAFLKETASIRSGDWKVTSTPADLQDRRVEITGPVETKMMINAFNSGAKVFMADLEDSCSPTWANIIEGQINLKAAVRRTLQFTSPEGKEYKLKDQIATLFVRPRGWHLEEKNVHVDGKAVSASLFDFALYFFHNAKELLKRGSGPYLYLPKMESHLEARLWSDVFAYAETSLGTGGGKIRATVLIETITAAFEMDEILYELRNYIVGLNAGRWDYIFSFIKKFRDEKDAILPDRAQVSMTVPFMRAYTELLVQTCHKRGAHAMGGMSAFIPSRKDLQVNEIALQKVREDKDRESNDGFDGTWVAHPDLVPIALQIFDKKLGSKPNQKDRLREEVNVRAEELVNAKIAGFKVTETGVRNNISVALQYIARWLEGLGAVAIHNLMEDAATAEISRAQLWQWIKHKVAVEMKNGSSQTMSGELYNKLKSDILKTELSTGSYARAEELLDTLVLENWTADFLTLPAYRYL